MLGKGKRRPFADVDKDEDQVKLNTVHHVVMEDDNDYSELAAASYQQRQRLPTKTATCTCTCIPV